VETIIQGILYCIGDLVKAESLPYMCSQRIDTEFMNTIWRIMHSNYPECRLFKSERDPFKVRYMIKQVNGELKDSPEKGATHVLLDIKK
jgi:hypothetical protein